MNEKVRKVQRGMTTMIPGLVEMSCENCLIERGLTS